MLVAEPFITRFSSEVLVVFLNRVSVEPSWFQKSTMFQIAFRSESKKFGAKRL